VVHPIRNSSILFGSDQEIVNEYEQMLYILNYPFTTQVISLFLVNWNGIIIINI